MNRSEFMGKLAELIRPRSPLAASTQLAKMLPFLTDMPDGAFCEGSLQALAGKLKRSPSFADVRAALDSYCRVHGLGTLAPATPPPETTTERERRDWDARQDALHAEWNDPAGIRARIRTCDGDLRWLRVLAALVAKWAPQHLGLLPPLALASSATVGEIIPPPATRAAYLTPAQLDQVNPLQGRTRDGAAAATHDRPATPRAAPVYPDTDEGDDAIPF
jgi:hypothetical protein